MEKTWQGPQGPRGRGRGRVSDLYRKNQTKTPSPSRPPILIPVVSVFTSPELRNTQEWTAMEKKVKTEAQESGEIKMDAVVKFLFADRQGLPTPTWSFLIIDFNVYGSYQEGRKTLYIPGEVGIVAFSVSQGVIDSFFSRIDPGAIPLGSGHSVMSGIKKRGLPFPGFNKEFQNHKEIFENLEKFVKSHWDSKDQPPMLFFFNEEDNASIVPGCLRWLHQEAFGQRGDNYDDDRFNVQPLTKLLYRLSLLGSSIREEIDPVQKHIELKAISKTRKDMTINHGLGRLDLTPVTPSHSQEFGYFPEIQNGQYHHRTDAEQIMERLGKFCSEQHARRYFRTSNSNLFNEALACAFHKQDENQDPGMQYCSELLTKKLALNMYDALHLVFYPKIKM